MEFLSQHVIAPTGHYMILLEFLAALVYVIHLPFVGVVLGATALSMFLTFRDREVPDARFARLAGDIVETFLGSNAALFVLGVFPLLVLPVVYVQWFHGTDATPVRYIPWAIAPAVLGMIFVVRYRNSFVERRVRYAYHMRTGLLAVGLLKVAYFILLASVARLHDPEKWYRVKNIVILLLNWNVIWKFGFFLHLAMAFTGAAILVWLVAMRRDELARDPDYARFVTRWGGGLLVAFSLALPVYWLFYVFTTPDVAFDNTVYGLATLLVAVGLCVALEAVGVLGGRDVRPLRIVVAFGALMVIGSTVDLRAMANANREHFRLVEMEAEQEKALRQAEIESRMQAATGAAGAPPAESAPAGGAAGTAGEPDPALVGVGEKLYQMKGCMACHSTDGTPRVGPSFKGVWGHPVTVVAGGTEKTLTVDVDYVRRSILDPTSEVVKGYQPLMPPQPLTDREIDALVSFIRSLGP